MEESTKLHMIVVVIFSIFISLAILLFGVIAQASPFLVCDPTSEGVTKYELEVNGVVEPATLEQVNGQVRIHHDLAGWPEGSYTVRARAGNEWDWSVWCDPLDFAKAIPAPVSGLGIEE